MCLNIDYFKDKYLGQVAALIGTGASLVNLRREQLADVNLVLTLTRALLKVRELNLGVQIFTLQKDAPTPLYQKNSLPSKCPQCDYACLHVKPMDSEILINHIPESRDCSPEAKQKYLYDNAQFGRYWYNPSVVSALHILKLFGVARVVMVSFDAVTHGDCRATYDGHSVTRIDDDYLRQVEITKQALQACTFKETTWLTPK